MDIQPGDRVAIRINYRERLEIALNVIILVLAAAGTSIMLRRTDSGAVFIDSGISNFKYFTVLSNELSLIVAFFWLILNFFNIRFSVLLKLVSASAVGLTFLIIAAFLAPMYPDLNMYEGSNLYFHLIVPLIAMFDAMVMETDEKIPFKYTFISAAFSLIYGICYFINIEINGIGVWPESNDWYGFLNWGYPIGFVIFAAIILMNWGIACLLRFINNLVNRHRHSMIHQNYK